MGKRKLTIQQQRRIRERRRDGGSPSPAEMAADRALGPEREGVVITRYGSQADVLPPDFSADDQPQRCHIRANLTDLVTGDRIVWREGHDTGVIERARTRQTIMARPDKQGRSRPVAANVDRIAVVIAPEPRPHASLIDRYLVAAETQGIRPLIILNKVDLLTGPDAGHLKALLDTYAELDYEVLRVSARNGDGMGPLFAYLADHTSVLVGQSGVGKSTLVNILCPGAAATVGSLSEQAAKGRHTTTSATLYAMPNGGRLIDSPGIREFGLWHLDTRAVAEGFVEFRPVLGGCRFRDCRHLDEPGCAVLEAAARGQIQARRLASYQHIVRELLDH